MPTICPLNGASRVPMKIAHKPTVAPTAVACILALIWVTRSNTTTDSTERDALRVELQNGSFCPLSWSIAEFKLDFSKHFGELLLQLDQARSANDGPVGALKNAQLAVILEDVLAEARSAFPIQSMEAYLLRFYRAAGLTNRLRLNEAQLGSDLDRTF